MEKRVLTVKEAAEEMGISTATFRKYMRCGDIAHIRRGHRIWVMPDAIDAFYEKYTVNGQI